MSGNRGTTEGLLNGGMEDLEKKSKERENEMWNEGWEEEMNEKESRRKLFRTAE